MGTQAGTAQQVISLPKGGGAVKGIGETFQPNLFSGTGNYSIPIAISPGRNDIGPSLSLQYSSGNGNGSFGLGWQLSLSRVTRKTEKGLPKYDESDVFVLSGVEDLVPCLKKVVDPVSGDVSWLPEDPIPHGSYTAYRYRPRTEGPFARIERWVDNATDEAHWRATTKDNITSIYGAAAASRIADPDNEERVYEWFLCETFDASGNHVLYEYARDNPRLYSNEDAELRLDGMAEENRRATQLYIRRIYYGNLPHPLLDENGNALTYSNGSEIGHLIEGRRYAFEVVFDYGDWDMPTKEPHPDPLPPGAQELFGSDPSTSSAENPVPVRADRFSNFRAGFEIRTLRRCRRVLMFHHFAELRGPTLVRATEFTYRNDPDTLLSSLTDVRVTGYQKDSSGSYRSASMPSVTFGYSEFRPHDQRYQPVTAAGNDMPPLALKNPGVTLVDLFGDGLPDVLQSSAEGFRYWKNLGDGFLDRPRSMSQIPAGISLVQPGIGFGDMGGDGRADLLVHSGPVQGFFETTSDGTWETFKPYDVVPPFNLGDANVRLIDLTGDGLSDALLTDDDDFVWFECLGEKGFAPPQHIARRHDLDLFPDLSFSDPEGRVRLADMTGDGLNDIVLIHNGRIDYWPNLGYGRFGRRIAMENAPHLEVDFDPKRLFLADLNGTGCSDLIYVDFDRVHFCFNQSGNRWSDMEMIPGTPIVTNADAVQFADVFGTGTATLVWSYDYAAQPEGNYKALDFCGGVKPYVLTEMSNNMGATTRVRYASSTRYFIEDQANGTPWATKLPFPVQVVDKVEVIDHISKTKLVTTYKYHHGYFDGREREFRGFGRVDQFDTETFEDFTAPGLHGDSQLFNNGSSAYHVPPVETRSWFHTGIYFDEDIIDNGRAPFDYRELTNRFRKEFYQGDNEVVPLGEHEVEGGDAPYEAYRALRGALLRTEIYGRDSTAKAGLPYSVTENRYRVVQLQPRDGNNHAVYFSHQIETLSYHYERNPADPRINHAMNLEVDAFGNPLRSLAIAYGRRQPDPALPTQADRDKQALTFVIYTKSDHTNAVNDVAVDPDSYRTPLPSEKRTYELTGFRPMNNAPRFGFDEWVNNGFARLDQTIEIAYEEAADPGQEQKRLIEHIRTYYRRDDLTDLLPLGVLESRALSGDSYKLALTPGLLAQVYGGRVTVGMLSEGGYTHTEGDVNWWLPSSRVYYSPNIADVPAEELAFARRHFFAPHRSRDPFGNTAFVTYDPYDLLLQKTLDAVGNSTIAENNYRLLQPFRVTDLNGNRAEAAFDTLGLVTGTAVMGKVSETKGDSLAGLEVDLTPQQRQDFFENPMSQAAGLLGQATVRTVYNLERYQTTQQPAFVATLARETHVSEPSPPGDLKIHLSFSHSDGFGREIQKKIQAEPGPAPQRNANGEIILDTDGQPLMTANDINPRWVGSGWTVFNNKGKPVRRYEPFFTDTHRFEFDVRIGVSPILFYDPVERAVATVHPNHAWEKVVFDPWQQSSYDVNDTVLNADGTTDPRLDPDVTGFLSRLPVDAYLPSWYEQRIALMANDPERVAAEKAAVHRQTPTVAHFDSLGRPFLAIAANRFERNGSILEEEYATRVEYDIEGNQREIIDANGRIVMRYDYDMLGARIHQASMEAGERWTLNDVVGKPIYAWDSRDHRFHTIYDPLRRPTDALLREGTGPDRAIGRTIYGESISHPELKNARGKVVRLFDQAGVAVTENYDFKGNLLHSARTVAADYNKIYDWNNDPVDPLWETFTGGTTYDALNRPIQSIAPHNNRPGTKINVIEPIYNEANLLNEVHVWLNQNSEPTGWLDPSTANLHAVANIDYNAKGQRVLITYGNNVKTEYKYDSSTFRLTNLKTTRGADQAILQDLHYTYDPVGNITQIQDSARQTIYFNNQVVTADANYIYDAVYRLIEAEGREHIGQASHPETTWSDEFRVKLQHPQDAQAMRGYTERYEYDAVGNFFQLIHQASNGDWTRSYSYNEPSLIEPGMNNNRLTSTTVGGNSPEPYTYDAHGNLTSMPHLPQMESDFRDQLQRASLGGGGDVYYVYDAGGQRARKVVEKNGGTLIEERLYLGGFEIFRRRNGGGAVTLERETLHVTDDKQRIALVETRTQGSEPGVPQRLIRYQFDNHLSSAILELDDQAQIISYEEFYPYGSTSYQAGRSAAEVSLKRYRYTGMERDEESGLSSHGVRLFASWLGRWTGPDPAGVMAGVNLYIYAFANPIRYSDPNGRQPEDDEPAVLGPKPIGLLSMDYWSPGTCGGYYRCVTDHAIDAPLKKSRAEDKQAEQRAHNARKQAMREQKLEHLANQTSVLNRHHWSDHEKDVYRYEHFKETGIDVGRAPGRVNIEGAPGPENIVLGHIGMFLLGAAAGPSAAAEETLAVEGEVTAETVLADEGAGALEEVAANEATGEGADALGRGLANEAAPLAEEESTTVTVQRFCDVTNPQTMMSEAATTSEATAAQGARILSDPTKLELAGELHAQGMLPIESPFVSVLENPTQGIMAGEPTLTTIATGAPGVAGVESAPFLATFEVPANLLYAPTWSISQLESELLFFGEDLSKYLVSAIPNPFLP